LLLLLKLFILLSYQATARPLLELPTELQSFHLDFSSCKLQLVEAIAAGVPNLLELLQFTCSHCCATPRAPLAPIGLLELLMLPILHFLLLMLLLAVLLLFLFTVEL
ncbi:hypothetical protein CRG98_046528, partial [Punica granatum]